MRVVGIDPGKTGALACFEPAGERGLAGAVIDIIDMPIVIDPALGDLVDPRAIAAWLDGVKVDQLWVERVTAMPSIKRQAKPGEPPPAADDRRDMGATSAFNFGWSAATVFAVVRVCGWSPRYVMPGVWKKHYGLKSGGDPISVVKERSRQRALELLPSASHFLTRKKDSARAEALLIARYGVFHDRVEAKAEREWAPRPRPDDDELPPE